MKITDYPDFVIGIDTMAQEEKNFSENAGNINSLVVTNKLKQVEAIG